MSNRKLSLLLACVVSCLRVTVHGETKELRYPYQSGSPLLDGSNYFCESIVGVFLEASPNDVGGLKRGIVGEVKTGTDKISVKIDGDKLYLMTKASFELGDAKTDPMMVVARSTDRIIAIDDDSTVPVGVINLFSLNPKTGNAIWTKQTSNELWTSNPDLQSYNLKCSSR